MVSRRLRRSIEDFLAILILLAMAAFFVSAVIYVIDNAWLDTTLHRR